jgi:ABC-type transporter Mla subunit MlaD
VQFSLTSFLFRCENGYDCSALIEETETARLRWQSIAIVLIASLALISWIVLHSRSHSVSVKAYFDDARGLHAGAAVNIAGVAVGNVSSVRIRPELRDNPAEVVLLLNTPYELKIPEDSTVSVE